MPPDRLVTWVRCGIEFTQPRLSLQPLIFSMVAVEQMSLVVRPEEFTVFHSRFVEWIAITMVDHIRPMPTKRPGRHVTVETAIVEQVEVWQRRRTITPALFGRHGFPPQQTGSQPTTVRISTDCRGMMGRVAQMGKWLVFV